ncbi:MAG TPA: hypothetical protein VLB83_00080 [Candidatus Paceibacterota bacterium]|nr:hypothetical protein [Candidatus Paceibacterota bacterium]
MHFSDSPVAGASIDHIAMPTCDLNALVALKRYLGWKTEGTYRPDPDKIGDGRTSMRTVVVSSPSSPSRPLPAQLALMQGIDNMRGVANQPSQVNAYLQHTRGIELMVQHIAFRIPCGKLIPLVRDWEKKGVRFITEHEGPDSPFCVVEEGGMVVRQAFTYPIMPGGLFYELKEVLSKNEASRVAHADEFQDANVRKLWLALGKLLEEKTLFKMNIFGELGPLRHSLEKRGIPIDR